MKISALNIVNSPNIWDSINSNKVNEIDNDAFVSEYESRDNIYFFNSEIHGWDLNKIDLIGTYLIDSSGLTVYNGTEIHFKRFKKNQRGYFHILFPEGYSSWSPLRIDENTAPNQINPNGYSYYCFEKIKATGTVTIRYIEFREINPEGFFIQGYMRKPFFFKNAICEGGNLYTGEYCLRSLKFLKTNYHNSLRFRGRNYYHESSLSCYMETFIKNFNIDYEKILKTPSLAFNWKPFYGTNNNIIFLNDIFILLKRTSNVSDATSIVSFSSIDSGGLPINININIIILNNNYFTGNYQSLFLNVGALMAPQRTFNISLPEDEYSIAQIRINGSSSATNNVKLNNEINWSKIKNIVRFQVQYINQIENLAINNLSDENFDLSNETNFLWWMNIYNEDYIGDLIFNIKQFQSLKIYNIRFTTSSYTGTFFNYLLDFGNDKIYNCSDFSLNFIHGNYTKFLCQIIVPEKIIALNNKNFNFLIYYPHQASIPKFDLSLCNTATIEIKNESDISVFNSSIPELIVQANNSKSLTIFYTVYNYNTNIKSINFNIINKERIQYLATSIYRITEQNSTYGFHYQYVDEISQNTMDSLIKFKTIGLYVFPVGLNFNSYNQSEVLVESLSIITQNFSWNPPEFNFNYFFIIKGLISNLFLNNIAYLDLRELSLRELSSTTFNTTSTINFYSRQYFLNYYPSYLISFNIFTLFPTTIQTGKENNYSSGSLVINYGSFPSVKDVPLGTVIIVPIVKIRSCHNDAIILLKKIYDNALNFKPRPADPVQDTSEYAKVINTGYSMVTCEPDGYIQANSTTEGNDGIVKVPVSGQFTTNFELSANIFNAVFTEGVLPLTLTVTVTENSIVRKDIVAKLIPHLPLVDNGREFGNGRIGQAKFGWIARVPSQLDDKCYFEYLHSGKYSIVIIDATTSDFYNDQNLNYILACTEIDLNSNLDISIEVMDYVVKPFKLFLSVDGGGYFELANTGFQIGDGRNFFIYCNGYSCGGYIGLSISPPTKIPFKKGLNTGYFMYSTQGSAQPTLTNIYEEFSVNVVGDEIDVEIYVDLNTTNYAEMNSLLSGVWSIKDKMGIIYNGGIGIRKFKKNLTYCFPENFNYSSRYKEVTIPEVYSEFSYLIPSALSYTFQSVSVLNSPKFKTHLIRRHCEYIIWGRLAGTSDPDEPIAHLMYYDYRELRIFAQDIPTSIEVTRVQYIGYSSTPIVAQLCHILANQKQDFTETLKYRWTIST